MDRCAPFDIQAERATLGACILDRDAVMAVADWLPSAYFYLEKHALIYDAVLACYARREPPDLATVAAELRRQERLEIVGGVAFLGELLAEVPTAVHIEYYGRTVERTAVLRRLIEAGGKIAALGYDEGGDLETTLDRAEAQLFSVSQQRQGRAGDGVDLADAVGGWWDRLSRLHDGSLSPGLATGWPDLDRYLLLEDAMLHVWAARPGVGKSALALALARNLAQAGYQVDYYSLEMKRDNLITRLVAMESGIDGDALRRGAVDAAGLRLAAQSAGVVATWPIHICDRFDLSTIGLRAYARRRHATHPASLIILDHLGLLVPPRAENRNVAVGEITRGLVHLAGELGVPILALSQLNREVEKRASKVPNLADLRDSGNIEQDAATVTFLHRPELYDQDSDTRGLMEMHVAKNRNGSLGVAALRFDSATMRTQSLERYREPGYAAD